MDGDLVEVVRSRSLESKMRQQDEGSQVRSGRYSQTHENPLLIGVVRSVMERAHETIVGTLHYQDGLAIVHPHNEHIPYDIFLDPRAPQGRHAKEGAIVSVRMTTYPGRLEAASGYIEEVIGEEGEQGLGIEVIIREHGLETVFSAAALEEGATLASRGFTEKEESLLRRDLRGRFIFTIDPSDAKDFDDAISVDFIEGQLRLGVHIADVSAYVAWDGAIDLDARRRATSVYLPDRVIPMLPPLLCDELCSLKAGEDKFAFTIDMLIDSNGAPLATEFYPSRIRSSVRLSYDEVAEILDDLDKGVSSDHESLLHRKIQALRRLAKKLQRRRLQRGAIEFASVEPKLTLDQEGRVVGVRLRTKTEATSIIEEAMILANEQVAGYMLAHDAPAIYRVHDEPLANTLSEILPVLQEFGHALQGIPQSSREIQEILASSEGSPEHHLLSSLLLRAMKRARYATTYTTHFGLASRHYTHFTSPIRRYPDLMVHRLLKYRLADMAPPTGLLKQLDWICDHASEMEREAEQASFEATALKLCEFLKPRVGETFSGIITSLSASGFTVREDETTAEGYVERESLPEGFLHDRQSQRYHDPESGGEYRLRQPVRVILKAVDVSRVRLQFVIA